MIVNKRIKYVGYSSVLALLFSATYALAEQYWTEVDDLTELSTQHGYAKVSAIKERRLVLLDLPTIRSLAQGATSKSGVFDVDLAHS